MTAVVCPVCGCELWDKHDDLVYEAVCGVCCTVCT